MVPPSISLGSGAAASITSRGRTSLPRTLTGFSECMFTDLKTSIAWMNSSPSAYLKVAFFTPLSNSWNQPTCRTSSCSTWATSTQPMPSGR